MDKDRAQAYTARYYPEFIERLAAFKAGGGLSGYHLWLIVLLMAACTFFYYAEQVLPLDTDAGFFYSVHDLHRLLFFIPMVYAAITYRLRGGITCSLVFLAIILPRALFISTYPDPLTRALIFFFFALLFNILIAVFLNYIEHYVNTRGRLQKLAEEMAELTENRRKVISFFNMAAHDMKAPLVAVQNYCNTMLGGYTGELNEKQRQWIQRSYTRLGELNNLISDLLDFVRIEESEITRDMTTFSLTGEIGKCVDEAKQIVDTKKIGLTVEAGDVPVTAYGSADFIKRALVNLISNAINYTPENGNITIKVSDNGPDALVEVTDTGIGIPPDELPRIFEDFYRASNVKSLKGTGLGLSIVKFIIELHRGKIWAESPPPGQEQGSRFSFSLPREKPAG